MREAETTKSVQIDVLLNHIDDLARARSLAGALWMAAHQLGHDDMSRMTELAALVEDRIGDVLRNLRTCFDVT